MNKERASLSSFLAVGAVALSLALAGCSSSDKSLAAAPAPVGPTVEVGPSDSFESAGKKMLPSLIRGLQENNYEIYSRDFSDNHKKYFDKAMFDRAAAGVRDKLGSCLSSEYVGSWKKGDFVTLLWKARYSSSEDDVLFKMYLKKDRTRYFIEAFKVL